MAPVVRRDDYAYFVHPLTDGTSPIEAGLLEEAVAALAELLPPRFDVLLAPEAMGPPLATALTLTTRRPFLVARKRSYGLPGEVAVPYRTGYASGHFYVNGLRPADRVVLVDDVLSQGGTLRALARGVREAGATLVKSCVLINKDHDLAALGRDLGVPVDAVVRIRIRDGRVEVIPSHEAARLRA